MRPKYPRCDEMGRISEMGYGTLFQLGTPCIQIVLYKLSGVV